MKTSIVGTLLALLAGVSVQSGAQEEIAWRYQARHGDIVLTANPLGKASNAAFYTARGFSAAAIRPYAQACGFSFGMQNGSARPVSAKLADWRAIGADGRQIAFKLPETWDIEWEKSGVTQAARIAFRWAQFQSVNVFEPGDWIMGMATLEQAPSWPFRLVARYTDENGKHEIVLDKVACAD